MEPKNPIVDKTLESLEGISRAKANPYLYQKIINRRHSQLVKPETVRWAIIIAMLFISINIISVVHYKNSSSRSGSYGTFEKEYFSYLNSNM